MLKKLVKVVGLAVAAALVAVAIFVSVQVHRFNVAARRHYEVPVPALTASRDPAVIEHGKHLTRALGGCLDCHGEDGGGGKSIAMGPLGTFDPPNITSGKDGKLAQYTDGELARLIVHGVKKDGTTVYLMPSREFSWWPVGDQVAVISYLRTLPPKDGHPGGVHLGLLAKVLDPLDKVPLDMARRIDHAHLPQAPAPSETPAYGRFMAMSCRGCHGDHLSGGPIPGAPSSLPIPRNLTPDATGLKDWSYADFEHFIDTGIRKNGAKLDPFMPLSLLQHMNPTERKALWAYLRSLPPRPFGHW